MEIKLFRYLLHAVICLMLFLFVTGCSKDNSNPIIPVTNYPVTDVDGNSYNTILIGTQTWLQQNLKVTRYSNGDSIHYLAGNQQWDTTSKGAYCFYNNNPSNKQVYGNLYNWNAVSDPRNICPPGWHVPTNDDWKTLINYLGGEFVAGGKMKESGTIHWAAPNQDGTNSSGFTGLPGSKRINSGIFSSRIDSVGSWWSITRAGSFAYTVNLEYSESYALRSQLSQSWGLSVRCIKNLGATYGSFTDIRDGKSYKTIQIGSQTWMAENLNYDTAGSWMYDNNSVNASIYGRLYNWTTACKTCPSGWKLPSDGEWLTLIDHLGGGFSAGGPIKATGTTYWNSPNEGATNTSGFSALPGGERIPDSYPTDYYYKGIFSNFWSSTQDIHEPELGVYYQLDYQSTAVWRLSDDKSVGFSVRCIKSLNE